LVLIAPAAAHADRPFASRFTTNDFGSITFAANTLMTCPDSAPTCASARAGLQGGSLGNNNGYAMTYVDVDGDSATFNSSTATLSLPQDAFVLFAGLYWAGDTSAGAGGAAAPTPSARGTVLLRPPGAAGYSAVTATTLDTNGTRFSGFRDVTDTVRAAGAGAYTVANLQSGKGQDRYGAWDLVVAYGDPTQPARNLTVFDGLATISQSTSAATLSLSGFTTPLTGPVRTVVGLISSEGDRTSTGDSATLNGRALFDDLNPANNVFNSSISMLGARFTAKVPDYDNQLGSDANSFNADGYLANGATSATIRLTTGGETYYPSVVFFTSGIYSPKIQPAKSVVDLNGGAVERGDLLEYTVRLTNEGQDAATGLRLFDPVPANAAYEPGTLEVTPAEPGAACPGFGPVTDVADGDQAEFDGGANRAVYRVGTGASGSQSGRLDPGQTACVRLRVRIGADAPLGARVVNQGAANFFGATLNTPFPNVLSNEAAVTVSGADLVPTKTHTGGTFVAGQSYDFTIGVRNAGDIATDGSTVTVTDPFPLVAFSSMNSAAGSGWSCTTGQTVTCTRSDALGAGQSWPPITINVTVRNPAPPTIVNTAAVAGGGDVDGSNNTATDAGGAIAQADLALSKVSDVTTSPARRDVTFTLDVSNHGPSTASAAQVTDTLAPDFAATEVTSTHGSCTTAVVCQLGALAPGEVATITIVARVQDGAANSTAANTATVQDTGGSSDPVPANDSASVDITVPPTSDLQLTKSVSPAEPQAGGPVTFMIPVTNAGPSVAQNVIVSDSIPPEIVFSSVTGTIDGGTCFVNADSHLIRCERALLAVGQTATVTIQATLAPDSKGKTVINSVQALSDSVDPQPDLAKDTVRFVPIPAMDLELTKVALNPPARPGGLARFRMQVANRGPSEAPDVVVRDTLPPGLTFVSDTRSTCTADGANVTCPLGDLASGQTIDDLEIEVRVDPSLAGQTVRNTATIDSEPTDPALRPAERIASSNEDTAQLDVAETADLRITKTVTPATVAAGGDVTYTIRATNDGPGEATDVRVVDRIPDGLRVRSVTATQGSCDTGTGIVCSLGTLSRGDSAEVRVTAGVAVDQSGRTIVNGATVTAAEVDLDQADNIASASLSVVPPVPTAECLANVLRLVDVAAGRTRTHLVGETAGANAGKTVTLLFRGRRVGTAVVDTNGTFTASLPLPPRNVRTTNLARYQAVLGPLRSLNLKLARRMRTTALTSSAGNVTIAGRVTSPLARPVRTVTLRQYNDCTGTSFTVVKRGIEVSRDGRFRATVPAAAGVDVAYYRALTRVRKTTANPKTYQTFTLLRGVTVRRG
jgi:uncharacterized repeat protein (TIGR01451 family)